MADEQGIPANVQALIAQHIESVVQLEVLLLLSANPERGWTAAQIAQELRIDTGGAAAQLETLIAKGFLARDPAQPEVVRFSPSDAAAAGDVAGLAKAYADRRVAVTAMIYSKPIEPIDPVRTFADAFRLRKERPDG